MNDDTSNNLFLVCHDICFVHLVIRCNCVVLCRIVLYYVIVQFFILYLCLIVIYLSSSTIIFNINFLAHGKKDNYCLHETTVESIFKLLIYIICYNTCAFMLKYKFIHSFKWPPCSILTISHSIFDQIIKKWIFLKSTRNELLTMCNMEFLDP